MQRWLRGLLNRYKALGNADSDPESRRTRRQESSVRIEQACDANASKSLSCARGYERTGGSLLLSASDCDCER